MTEQELRELLVSTVSLWIGAKRGDATHRHIVDTYNLYLPHPRGYKMTYTADWCAATVSAAGIVSNLQDIIPVECSCGEMIRLYQELGRWVEDDSYIPQMGDVIFYSWKDDGKGDNRLAPNHVGIVSKVKGNTITVVEGNMGSRSVVGTRNVPVNGRYIRGYGIPDYAGKAAQMAKEEEYDMKLYRYVEELPYGKESVTKAIQNGYIKLVEDDSMGLWEPNIQTIILLDRAGILDKPAIVGR